MLRLVKHINLVLLTHLILLLLLLNLVHTHKYHRLLPSSYLLALLLLLTLTTSHSLLQHLRLHLLITLTIRFEFLYCSQFVNYSYSEIFEFFVDRMDVKSTVMFFSEARHNEDEVDVLFLHFLMVATTLFSLPRSHEQLHCFEDLVHPTHMPVHKVSVVNLQEPVISLVLLYRPMTPIYVLCLLQHPSPPTTHLTNHLCPLILLTRAA